MTLCMNAHMCVQVTRKARGGSESFGAGVRGVCESPVVGADI